jgi:hypothetical protein
MIWESYYWKEDLKRFRKKILQRTKQKRWIEASNANAEKEIMISAFIIRKLFESKKLSNKFELPSIKVAKYRTNGKKIHLLRRLSPEKYFIFDEPIEDTLSPIALCNQIMHSYIFTLIMNEKRNLTHFWVVSDWDKFKYLHQVEIKQFLVLLKKVSEYWPQKEHYLFSEKKQDFVSIMH